MAERYQDPYRDRGRRYDRGFMERAGDEVRSWFGDDDAERRRELDERDRGREPRYAQSWDRGYADRGYYGDRGFPDRGYGYGYGSPSGYAPYGYGSGQRDRDYSGLGPRGYQRSDARINEDVCDRLCDSSEIDATNVDVSVASGEVTLSGSVADREAKRRAEEIAERVSGVREVCNNLRVDRGSDHRYYRDRGYDDRGSTSITGRTPGASGSGGGGDVAHPGITGGGPSGAANITTSQGTGGAAGAPENPLGLRESPETRTNTAGGRR